jgi:hypothetical protein
VRRSRVSDNHEESDVRECKFESIRSETRIASSDKQRLLQSRRDANSERREVVRGRRQTAQVGSADETINLHLLIYFCLCFLVEHEQQW